MVRKPWLTGGTWLAAEFMCHKTHQEALLRSIRAAHPDERGTVRLEAHASNDALKFACSVLKLFHVSFEVAVLIEVEVSCGGRKDKGCLLGLAVFLSHIVTCAM